MKWHVTAHLEDALEKATEDDLLEVANALSKIAFQHADENLPEAPLFLALTLWLEDVADLKEIA